jgi:hypothetical protein
MYAVTAIRGNKVYGTETIKKGSPNTLFAKKYKKVVTNPGTIDPVKYFAILHKHTQIKTNATAAKIYQAHLGNIPAKKTNNGFGHSIGLGRYS